MHALRAVLLSAARGTGLSSSCSSSQVMAAGAFAPSAASGVTARTSSSLNGNRGNPMESSMRSDPAFHIEDSRTTTTEAPYELKVPGVVGQGVEPNIAKPGTVDWPNPSKQLLQKVPIAKVTVDGDVIQADSPKAPAEGLPRN